MKYSAPTIEQITLEITESWRKIDLVWEKKKNESGLLKCRHPSDDLMRFCNVVGGFLWVSCTLSWLVECNDSIYVSIIVVDAHDNNFILHKVAGRKIAANEIENSLKPFDQDTKVKLPILRHITKRDSNSLHRKKHPANIFTTRYFCLSRSPAVMFTLQLNPHFSTMKQEKIEKLRRKKTANFSCSLHKRVMRTSCEAKGFNKWFWWKVKNLEIEVVKGFDWKLFLWTFIYVENVSFCFSNFIQFKSRIYQYWY